MAEEYNPVIKAYSVADMAANVEAGKAAWAARLEWFAARGLKPRLLDMDDLAREAAGLPPDPPYELADGRAMPVAPNERSLVEKIDEIVESLPTHAEVVFPTEIAPEKRTVEAVIDSPQTTEKMSPQVAKQHGYTGDACQCGSFRTRRNGTCMVCDDCGTTTGCS